MWNFSPGWVTGTNYQKASNFLDHANSEQHLTSMAGFGRLSERKAQGMPTSSYTPIVCSVMVLGDVRKSK